LQQALATKERVYGPQHPGVANSLSQLGDLYRQQGKADEAERLFRRALAIHKATVREIPVYFATDRKQDKNAKTITFSADSTDATLTYGQATVIIAKPDAAPGSLSNARLPNADAGKAQTIETTEVGRLAIRDVVVSDERQLMEAAQKRLDTASVFPKQAFVFVHGFNVSFENALRRTAQIAYDLNFDGAPFLFSWPGGDVEFFDGRGRQLLALVGLIARQAATSAYWGRADGIPTSR
jgi:esterase/lipase superfamily enzyme